MLDKLLFGLFSIVIIAAILLLNKLRKMIIHDKSDEQIKIINLSHYLIYFTLARILIEYAVEIKLIQFNPPELQTYFFGLIWVTFIGFMLYTAYSAIKFSNKVINKGDS